MSLSLLSLQFVLPGMCFLNLSYLSRTHSVQFGEFCIWVVCVKCNMTQHQKKFMVHNDKVDNQKANTFRYDS